MSQPLTYHWSWHLDSPAELFWEYISNTNRLNHDLGLPVLSDPINPDKHPNGRLQFRAQMLGMPVEWLEEPFQWQHPYTFKAVRHFTSGPVEQAVMRFSLSDSRQKTTRLDTEITIHP